MKLPSSLRLPCTLISAFQRLCFFDSPMKRDSLSGREGLLGFCLQQKPQITAHKADDLSFYPLIGSVVQQFSE